MRLPKLGLFSTAIPKISNWHFTGKENLPQRFRWTFSHSTLDNVQSFQFIRQKISIFAFEKYSRFLAKICF